MLDEVIPTAMRAEKDTAKENYLEADNLDTMMQVMFNAGVTLALED